MYQILLMCGGDGSEHDVSLKSALYLEEKLNNIKDVNLFKVIIHKNYWETEDHKKCFLNNDKKLVINNQIVATINYVVPCIHGFPGETGDIQSYLELIGIPYLGCPSEGSKLCFNKISTKLWLSSLNIPNTPYIFLSENNEEEKQKSLSIMDNWKSVFVKAASQGSSVGCYKVTKKEDLILSIDKAFSYSNQVLIEKAVVPRELEVAVYEYDGQIVVTNPGEIYTDSSTFYSFDEKYSSTSKATTTLEAKNLTDKQVEEIRKYAYKAFTQLKLKDLSRIDFFLTEDNEILLNEINTFPGMTPISMFPKLLEHNGHSMETFLLQRIKKGMDLL